MSEFAHDPFRSELHISSRRLAITLDTTYSVPGSFTETVRQLAESQRTPEDESTEDSTIASAPFSPRVVEKAILDAVSAPAGSIVAALGAVPSHRQGLELSLGISARQGTRDLITAYNTVPHVPELVAEDLMLHAGSMREILDYARHGTGRRTAEGVSLPANAMQPQPLAYNRYEGRIDRTTLSESDDPTEFRCPVSRGRRDLIASHATRVAEAVIGLTQNPDGTRRYPPLEQFRQQP